MSIKLLSLAFETDLTVTRKMLLLALSDYANEHNQCFPLVDTLVSKCSMSKETIFRALKDLEEMGYLVRINRNNHSSIYELLPKNWLTKKEASGCLCDMGGCLCDIHNHHLTNNNSKNSKQDSLDYQSIIDLYNNSMTENPKVKLLTDQRKTKIYQFFKAIKKLSKADDFDLMIELAKYFEYVKKNATWLTKESTDKSGTKHKPKDFDFFINIRNYTKIREGVWDDR